MNCCYVKMKIKDPTIAIKMNIGESDTIKFKMIEGGSAVTLPYFDGPYSVTPRIKEQKLDTKNKSMKDDVTIFQIPYNAVSNPAGGLTITIGLE